MIAVNLLPPHLRPVKRNPLPYVVAIAAWAAAIALCAMLFVKDPRGAGLFPERSDPRVRR